MRQRYAVSFKTPLAQAAYLPFNVLTQAVEIDPTYSKAWGRLAAASKVRDCFQSAHGCHRLACQKIGDMPAAGKAFETAISTLPSESLSAAEQRLKDEFETELNAIKKRFEPRTLNLGVFSELATVEQTIQRAQSVFPEVEKENRIHSSVSLDPLYRIQTMKVPYRLLLFSEPIQ